MVSYNTKQASDHIKPKLWMYFYLNQGLDEDVAWQTVMNMVEDLQEAGLETSFYTKEQAFSRLAQQLPSILEDFEAYGIENPLPPTLYVLFSDDREYQLMKSIVVRYEWLVTNANELTAWVNFSDQERRIQTTINAMNVLRYGSLLLVGALAVTLLWFLWYALRSMLVVFKDQVMVEKLLWAYTRQVALPFLLYALVIVSIAYVLFLLWAYWSMHALNGYSLTLFQQPLAQRALPQWGTGYLFLKEYGVVASVTLLASSGIMWFLLRKK